MFHPRSPLGFDTSRSMVQTSIDAELAVQGPLSAQALA